MRPIALLKFAEKWEHYNNPECLISDKIQPGIIIILPDGCMSSRFRIYEHSSPISLLNSKVFSWPIRLMNHQNHILLSGIHQKLLSELLTYMTCNKRGPIRSKICYNSKQRRLSAPPCNLLYNIILKIYIVAEITIN
jgi:hypothetical protein